MTTQQIASGLELREECKKLKAAAWPVDEFIALLERLPNEDDYSPDVSARAIGRNYPDALDSAIAIIRRANMRSDLKHKAFVTAATTLCNQYEFSKLKSILQVYRHELSQFWRWRLFSTMPVYLTSVEDFSEATRQIRDYLLHFDDDPGVLSHLAEIQLSAVERYPDYPNKDAVVEEAMGAISRAITIREYPKYYLFKGRAHLLRSQFPDARASINQAIDKEESSRGDYAVRLQTYHQYLAQVGLQEAIAQARIALTTQMTHELTVAEERSRSRQLEFMGFFVAIMSFVITGFGIAQRYPARSAAQLLFITASCLVAAVVGFSTISSTTPLRQRILASLSSVFVAGALLATAAWIVPLVIPGADNAASIAKDGSK